MRTSTTPSHLARIATIVRNAAVDTFRDRRTIMVTLLTAIVAGPVFIVLGRVADARSHIRSR